MPSPINRRRPLKRRGSLGCVSNHSWSTSSEVAIGWSVSSLNLRLKGVFQVVEFEFEAGGGVGTRGRGVAVGGFVGEAGAKDCAEASFT